MATIMSDNGPVPSRPPVETLSAEDFETASIRSAAPSYTSDAPSYHSTAPTTDPLPPYSPPARSAPAPASQPQGPPSRPNQSVSSLLPPEPEPTSTTTRRRQGLPPVPSGPLPYRPTATFSSTTSLPRTISSSSSSSSSSSAADLPSLSAFRIPPWSPTNNANNPTARIYRNVALRRASAAAAATSSTGSSSNAGVDPAMMRRAMALERIEEDQRAAVRYPLEDPYLVGEEAAAQARRERLARERAQVNEALLREDMQWDWFLAQLREREENGKNWRNFRQGRRWHRRLAFGIGARF